MSSSHESQAARYGADALMNMAGTLAEAAEGDLDRDRESLSRAELIQARASIAVAYARLAQSAAIQEATESVAGALGDVVAELASLREAMGVTG